MTDSSGSEIILCVDDDTTVLASLDTVFGKALGGDNIVELAENGQEALDICTALQKKGKEISVVIADFIMPGMRGDDLLVRLHEISPRTIKIMLTGQSDVQGVKRAINEANLYRFLEKPFNNADLLLTVKSALLAYIQERELERRNAYLEQRVKLRTAELVASNTELEFTLTNLRATQNHLIQAEKMASLGLLVANVAHEINTPIAAIKASGQIIAEALGGVLDHMPRLFDALGPEPRALFLQLISHAQRPIQELNSREKRAVTQETAGLLEESGIKNARHKAGILVQLHAQSQFADYMPLLQHVESEFILQTAHNVAAIINNSSNITMAVDRVSKIVFTLKSLEMPDNAGDMVDVNLQEGIESVLAVYRNQIRQHTELVCQFEELPPLRGLPDELQLVWTHLIHNALQAMPLKGKLSIGLSRLGDEAVVSVTDSGCGIAESIRARIFEAFFTTRSLGEGSGLGLDIVKKVVDKHHGRIDVQSEVGVGSTFSVYLPYGLMA